MRSFFGVACGFVFCYVLVSPRAFADQPTFQNDQQIADYMNSRPEILDFPAQPKMSVSGEGFTEQVRFIREFRTKLDRMYNEIHESKDSIRSHNFALALEVLLEARERDLQEIKDLLKSKPNLLNSSYTSTVSLVSYVSAPLVKVLSDLKAGLQKASETIQQSKPAASGEPETSMTPAEAAIQGILANPDLFTQERIAQVRELEGRLAVLHAAHGTVAQDLEQQLTQLHQDLETAQTSKAAAEAALASAQQELEAARSAHESTVRDTTELLQSARALFGSQTFSQEQVIPIPESALQNPRFADLLASLNDGLIAAIRSDLAKVRRSYAVAEDVRNPNLTFSFELKNVKAKRTFLRRVLGLRADLVIAVEVQMGSPKNANVYRGSMPLVFWRGQLSAASRHHLTHLIENEVLPVVQSVRANYEGAHTARELVTDCIQLLSQKVDQLRASLAPAGPDLGELD
jgi:hypothetical protein